MTTTTTEHDPVNAPKHYRSHPSGIECLEVTRQLSFDLGNAVKYVWRRNEKGTAAQDVEKALFYLADAVRHAPHSLDVPPAAAELLHRAAAADPDRDAAEFFWTVAESRWTAAQAAARQILERLREG